MIISIINSLFYLVTLLAYYISQKKFDLYFVLVSAYATVALFGTYDFAIGLFDNNFDMSAFRLFYLFAVIMICLKPYRGIQFNANNIDIFESKYITILLYFYMLCGIAFAYYTLPKAIMLQNASEWGSLRNDWYSGESSITLYDSQLERFAKNCYSYLSPFGGVITFFQLTKPKINKTLTLFLFSIWFVNSYGAATLVASRGMIMMLAMKITILYVIFRNSIPYNRKKYLAVIATFIGILFGIYTMAVTESRFGDESNDSLLSYFGHSMYAFNDGIMRTMHDYAEGRYQFGWLYRAFGLDSHFNWTALGCTHGTAFMTFVGNLYVDFGPFLTPIVAILMSVLVNHFTQKAYFHLSDLIVISFTATWFAEGVFVFAGDQSLQWLMVFVVYNIVKHLESKHIKQAV